MQERYDPHELSLFTSSWHLYEGLRKQLEEARQEGMGDEELRNWAHDNWDFSKLDKTPLK